MRFLPLLSLAALTGCVQDPSSYPSLLPRPIEQQSLAEPVRPVATATPDAALDAQIAEIRASIAASAKTFTAAAQEAEARIAVARGMPVGSDPWLNAQTSLATLDTLVAPVVASQTDLELLASGRGADGKPPYPALDSALAEANSVATAQSERIKSLEAAIAAP